MTKKHTGDVSGYKTRNLRCRGRNHPWTFVTDEKFVWRGDTLIEYTKRLRCQSCGSGATELYRRTPSGRFYREGPRHIDYVEGYLLTEDTRFDRADAVDEIAMRELVKSLPVDALDKLMAQRPDKARRAHLKAV